MKLPKILLTLMIPTVFAACGQSSSNPLEKYDGIKLGPVTDEKSETQTILKPDVFVIETKGTNEINAGQFVEGQMSDMLFKVSATSALVTKYSVELTDFSNLDRPTLIKSTEPGVYSLRWLPRAGTIPGGQWGKSFKAQIQVTVTESQSPALVGAVTIKSLDLIVNRNNSQPKISGRSELAKGIDEGIEQDFTVDVVDPGSTNNPRLPELQVTPYITANTEAYRADGSRYLVFDDRKQNNPEKIAANTFRFYYKIQVDHLPLDRDRLGKDIPAATAVDLCFQIRAVSVVGTLSDQLQICTKARYAAQPALIQLFNDQGQEVTGTSLELRPGVENLFTIKVSVEHQLGIVALSRPERLVASLSGKKEISCSYDSTDSKKAQTCTVKWTPACVSKSTAFELAVKAEAALDTKMKSSSLVKSLIVNADLNTCPVAKPKTTKPVVKGGK